MKLKNKAADFFNSLKWVLFVSRRFSLVDRKGSSKVNSVLASLGICFGVMTLITVISVMNGFQMSFIDSIMEISSYHIRVKNIDENSSVDFLMDCQKSPEIRSVSAFMEAQSLMTGKNGNQSAALIRAVPSNLTEIDSGFKKEAKMWSGKFDLSESGSVVLGSELARRLGVRPGNTVELFALSGGSDVSLISSERVFTVKGIFRCGYADINASYAFLNLEDGIKYFGKDSELLYGIKLFNTSLDSKISNQIEEKFAGAKCESWKEFNRSFFGTLKIEKNMIFFLVLIIFVVVAVNIFNGMRRRVFERREEISVLMAFGGQKNTIQAIFIMQGFLAGLKGAVPGLVLGLLLSVKMSGIFIIMSKIVYYIQLFFLNLFSPENAIFLRENPMYMIYANIPPRIFAGEVFFITLFGIFSALFASARASREVLNLTVSEVMRDE